MITVDDIRHRFAFHTALKPNGADLRPDHAAVREACEAAAIKVLALTPASREQSLAITHLEEAMMWGNAAIARGRAGDGR